MKIVNPLRDGEEARNEQRTRAEPAVKGASLMRTVFLSGATVTGAKKRLGTTLLGKAKSNVYLALMTGEKANVTE